MLGALLSTILDLSNGRDEWIGLGVWLVSTVPCRDFGCHKEIQLITDRGRTGSGEVMEIVHHAHLIVIAGIAGYIGQ